MKKPIPPMQPRVMWTTQLVTPVRISKILITAVKIVWRRYI
ncbi:MAG: hypothetical protein SPL89_09865 [Clostridia bacterium]|nr:hypothetical protein [Clostridia bacterium]